MLLHDVSPETTLEQQCQRLHEKATKDPLTQVANRAEFDRAYALFIEAHAARRLPCSLIICDIDHFKSINDTYGHVAGDEALKETAFRVSGGMRSYDSFGRYGGEEFLFVVPGCDDRNLLLYAERLRAVVESVPYQLGGIDITITASFGATAILPGEHSTPEHLIRAADLALYQAKRSGRNCVRYTPPEQMAPS
jgi:diguanylate cyclase (GGDEF)-like protein